MSIGSADEAEEYMTLIVSDDELHVDNFEEALISACNCGTLIVKLIRKLAQWIPDHTTQQRRNKANPFLSQETMLAWIEPIWLISISPVKLLSA